MEEPNPKDFDSLAEARASPMAKAVYPMLMFFFNMALVVCRS